MFVSITRQTPKLQQPHVCTSCLSKLLGASDALPLYSNAILSRAPRNIATFSTTRRNNENNQQTENVPEDLKRLKIDPLSKDGSGDNQKTNEASAGSAEAEPGTKSLTKLLEKKKQERKKKPVKAAKPAKPAKTAKPAKPAKPAKSAKPAKPAKSAKSAKQLNQLDGKGKGSQKAALGAEEIIFEDQHKVETESAVRIKRVKQKLINYVNSNCDSPSPSIRHLAVSVEEKKQEKIAPSQLHSIYQSMVAEKGEAAARKDLVDLIQKGGLTTTDRTQVMKELRASLVNRPRPVEGSKSATPSSSTNLAGMLASFESIHNSPVRKVSTKKSKNLEKEKQTSTSKASVSTKGQKSIRTGPIKKSPGTTEFEVKSIDVDSLQLVPVQKKQPPVPGLSYGLERALFNPGVYHLQDPRSRVFNFDPYLQQIMPVNEFDFTALKQYVTSSRDKALIETAKDEKRKYTGSTSSMSASLAHFHFLLSQWRPINTGMLSQEFPVEYNSFTALQRGPSAIFLRERDGVYAIDADKQFDTANILSMLGKSMEKLLTLPKEEFEQYRKENSGSITEDQRNEVESFHYTTMGDFLMRSQLDAHDPRLPGTGMFDLKTRAVISIRMDIDNYAEGSGYEIFNRHGEFESFEREYYDMIRARILKVLITVSSNLVLTYLTKPWIAQRPDSPENPYVYILKTRGNVETPFMYIFAEPMEEEDIQRIQDTNKAEIEAFESRVLGLHGDKATAEEQLEERKDAEWENLRAKIEESMENDEYEIKSAKEIAESGTTCRGVPVNFIIQ
ncbi:hypothetical protein EYC84_003219 [Monilinia fructicola]|uniref:Uncharacterized protein n=1 Tax=Monilinia fructicola TaxID=38448 RepID=A0A5M9JSY6_MONFR|nr:hypothetical protein EYC84_003219 [Monilinia fructicola]